MNGWPLRLFTTSMFVGIAGLVLLFIAVLPSLRALADSHGVQCESGITDC